MDEQRLKHTTLKMHVVSQCTPAALLPTSSTYTVGHVNQEMISHIPISGTDIIVTRYVTTRHYRLITVAVYSLKCVFAETWLCEPNNVCWHF